MWRGTVLLASNASRFKGEAGDRYRRRLLEQGASVPGLAGVPAVCGCTSGGDAMLQRRCGAQPVSIRPAVASSDTLVASVWIDSTPIVHALLDPLLLFDAHCRRPFSSTAGCVTHVYTGGTILPCPPLSAHACHPHIAGLAEELIIAHGSKDVHTRDAARSAAAGLEAHGAWQRRCFHCRQPEPAGAEGPGHLRVCAGCKSRLFCGKGCLNAAWPSHKRECKQLAAL